MSEGVQTNKLVLAQMDCPKPLKTTKTSNTDLKDGKLTQSKARCPTYNTCKTEDKYEYELSHPDKNVYLSMNVPGVKAT